MDLKQYVYDQAENMITLLEKLVEVESGSQNIAGVNKVNALVEEELEKLGFTTRSYNFEQAGSTLVGEKKGRMDYDLIILGHSDTVFQDGTLAKKPFRKENGKIFGPGVLDMKGGLVQALFAFKVLQLMGWDKYNLKIIVAGDEETGHRNSTAIDIFKTEAQKALCVFCCEIGKLDNKIVMNRKGVGELSIKVNGRASHAGNALLEGRNAAAELARVIDDVNCLYTNPEHGLTASVGYIEAGSLAVNIVPDKAAAIFDIRYRTEEAFKSFLEYLHNKLDNPPIEGFSSEIDYHLEYPPMVTTKDSERLFNYISSISERIGYGRLEAVTAGGGADSTFFSSMNVPTVCSFGPVGQHAHSLDEYIIEDELYKRTVLLAECLLSMDESVLV